MRIIAKGTLRAFWKKHPDAEEPLLAWHREVRRAKWESPAQVKQMYRTASVVADRIVFDIKGNRYRLVVRINYAIGVVYIRFVGTHKQYDAVDVKEV